MNMMMSPITPQAEQFLEDLAEELDIPEHRYDDATTSYESLGNWLKRDESTVRQFDPHIYVQGSFRLGTAIRPRDDGEEYDVDSVCEFKLLTKSQLSQAELKRRLGVEIHAYARSKNMVKPVREGRRCWILDYADGAQFHMDVVPALPNGLSQRLLLERHNLAAPWASTA
jgi:Second Messenger Oligonucleotide or Dinucleotide Synthetase domain